MDKKLPTDPEFEKKKDIKPEGEKNKNNPQDNPAPKDQDPKDNDPKQDPKKDEPKKKYNLEEVVEYTELLTKYEALKSDYDVLEQEKSNLESEVTSLKEFKLEADRKEKQSMIDGFYMLNDDDKKDVVEHIDTYSLEDIEAKLSILCVRNKVNFNLDKNADKSDDSQPQGLFNLENPTDTAPEWIKAIRANEKKL